jgi:hypothetical protein
MSKFKSEITDKQLTSTFSDPVNVYQGQYREISDRIRERGRREGEMDRLFTEQAKFQEKADARLAATETKLEAACGAYEDLNTELKSDIPVLLSKAENFFQPIILLLIQNQSVFWGQMAQFTTALAQRVDTSQAKIPELQQLITPKQSSAVSKKYSNTLNPWEREPLPALGYQANPTPALPAPAHYNPQQQPPAATAAYYNPQQQPPPHQAGGGGLPHRPPPVFPQNNPQVPAHNIHAGAAGGSAAGGYHPPQQQQTYVAQPGNPFAQAAASHNPSRPLPQAKPQAKALWDFVGQNPDEISFRAGETIIIHEQSGDWWKGEVHGRIGVLPANYVQLF